MSLKHFEEYRYYPTLRTRNAELKGLAKLDSERRKQILPLITLGKWPKSEEFSKSADKAAEAMSNGAFFIDLPDDSRHHTTSSTNLLKSDHSYKNWRDFSAQYETAIPVVQLAGGSRREIAQQARHFESDCGRLGFRIRDFQKDTPLVIAALSAIDDVENALVFVDAQYIRPALPAYIAAVTGTINALRSEIPETIIATLSTSFPASRMHFMDVSKQHGSIENMDHELHHNIGGYEVAVYGDHGSIHAVVYDDQPIMRWSPTIDYPLEYEWVFERRNGRDSNEAGYISAAQAIVAAFPEIISSTVWGDQMIVNAANGSVFGASPQSWIAVRVNLHLTRQIDLTMRPGVQGSDEQDDVEF